MATNLLTPFVVHAAITPANPTTTTPTPGATGSTSGSLDINMETNYLVWYEKCYGGTSTAAGATTGSSGANGGGCGQQKAGNVGGNKEDEDQVWDFLTSSFKNKGYDQSQSELAAAAIMGSWKQESGFNSYRTDGTGCAGNSAYGINGWGLAQWCGSRVPEMKKWAADHGGKDWTCLGSQLEFAWFEMETKFPQLFEKMKNTDVRTAARAFDKIFEGSDGSGDRDGKAEQILNERTGKGSGSSSSLASSKSNDPNSSGTCQATSAAATTSNAALPSADCQAAGERVRQLIAANKIKAEDNNNNKDTSNRGQDITKCKTSQILCRDGVHPEVLRALAGMTEGSGASEVWVRNMNTGHDCDNKQHPAGEAVDIYCPPDNAAIMENCKKILKYVIENKDKLGLGQIIWTKELVEAAGYNCSVVTCMGDHYNEIHVAIKSTK